MAWQNILGHDQVVDRFRRSLQNGRLASTFLFVGPPGIGKRMLALKIAQALLCETHPEEQLEPCGHCPGCQQVSAGTHPDLRVVGKPADKSFIPIETFIGDRDHRMSEGLCHDISLKPMCGGRKIAIVNDADFLNIEGANCLLKTLEEPPPRSLIILIGTSEQKQLPTIRSRCQAVRFQPLPDDVVADLLRQNGLATEAGEIEQLVGLAAGSVERAVELSEGAIGEFREAFLNQLSRHRWNAMSLAQRVTEFVDQAGKDAPPRRARLQQITGFAGDFYRQVMWSLSGIEPRGDAILCQAVRAAVGHWAGDEETAAACLDRCLAAQNHISRNANQAMLVESWLDDVSRGGVAAADW